MKITAWIVKYIIVPFSTLVGIIFSIDAYVVRRAGTVIEPTKVKVEQQNERLISIDQKLNILIERKN
jgi:hypothetical protein